MAHHDPKRFAPLLPMGLPFAVAWEEAEAEAIGKATATAGRIACHWRANSSITRVLPSTAYKAASKGPAARSTKTDAGEAAAENDEEEEEEAEGPLTAVAAVGGPSLKKSGAEKPTATCDEAPPTTAADSTGEEAAEDTAPEADNVVKSVSTDGTAAAKERGTTTDVAGGYSCGCC